MIKCLLHNQATSVFCLQTRSTSWLSLSACMVNVASLQLLHVKPAACRQEHQLAVIDCLEDPDDTLKLKTLELLYKMTKANNVEVGA